MAAIASAGSGNWSSTTPNLPWPSGTVPANGDTVTIGNGHTITLDQDLTIGADSATAAIAVSSGGKLQYLAAAAAAYTITSKGDISNSGTIEFGTTGSPIPANRGVTVLFDSASPSDGKYGWLNNTGSTCTLQGASKTIATTLAANASANATSLTTTDSTGWKDNDDIVIASTTRTPTETERGQLNGDASTTSLTVDGFAGTGGGVAAAHSGSGSTKAEVINLTRNIKIKSNSSTNMAYFLCETTATIDIDYVEFRYLGENATGKRGIEIKTTSGNCNIQYSSVADCEDYGVYITGSATNNVTFSNNVTFNLNSAAGSGTYGFRIDATSNVNTVSNNYFFGTQGATNEQAVRLDDVGLTFSGNVVVGTNSGSGGVAVLLNESAQIGTMNGITCHSNAGRGIQQSGGAAYTILTSPIQNINCWRNGSSGLQLAAGSYGVTFDTGTLFGNGSPNIAPSGGGLDYYLKNFTVDGDSTFTVGNGIFVQGNGSVHIYNSTFGTNVTHTSQDVSSQNNGAYRIYFYNCTLASSSQSNIQTGGSNAQSGHFLHRNGQTTSHKSYFSFGTITSDVTTRHTASGFSWKMTPNNASVKLILPGPTRSDAFRVPVNSGSLVTIKAFVQKDGSYNGNAPRLVMSGGPTQGISSNVIASLSVAAGNWEELTVTGTPTEQGVIEFYVDCDGTAGNVYVDDVTITQA